MHRAAGLVVLSSIGAASGQIDAHFMPQNFAQSWLLEKFNRARRLPEQGSAVETQAQAVGYLEKPGASTGGAADAPVALAAEILAEGWIGVDLHQVLFREDVADNAIDTGAISMERTALTRLT